MLPEPQVIPPARRCGEGEDFDILVRLKQAADECDRKPRTLLSWAAKGTLGFPRLVKINGRYFVSRRVFEAWKCERLTDTPSEA